jgi:branched-chain amino acid transport system permease protein
MNAVSPRGRVVFASTLLPLLLVVIVPTMIINFTGSPELISTTISALIMMVMVVGLQIFCGNSGVLAFGHAGFAAVGAYACGILTIPQAAKHAILPNLPFILAHTSVRPEVGVLIGGVTAAAIAAIAFYPLRRLNAQALSIATLSLLLIANVFFTNVRLSSSGGELTRVPVVATIGNVMPWALGTLLVAFVFQRSRLGLRLRASREDEFAAEAGGIDIGWTRMAAFVISAGVMGVGGSLYALSLGSYSADDFFLDISILLFAMMVVGGMKSLTGAVVGTILISSVNYIFAQFQNGVAVGDFTLSVPPGATRVAIALCMIIVLLFRREGLLGDTEIRLHLRRGVSGNARTSPSGDEPHRSNDLKKRVAE